MSVMPVGKQTRRCTRSCTGTGEQVVGEVQIEILVEKVTDAGSVLEQVLDGDGVRNQW